MTELQKQNTFFTFNVQVSIGLFLLAVGLAIFNNTFSLAFHADEWKKVNFVLNNEQDFHHPILLLQVSRIINWFVGSNEGETVVVIGRWVSALSFGIIAVLSFNISSKIINRGWAVLVGALVATSPILVVHGHYMKEDMIQTACLMLSLWQFIRLVENPTKKHIILLGVFCGLALSAHYKSVMLVPVFISVPFLLGIKKSWKLYLQMIPAAAIALVVFVIVNYPLLLDFEVFKAGFEHERTHAIKGHFIKIYPLNHFFIYHLRHSVIKGMTLPIAALAGIGILQLVARWRNLYWREKMLFIYMLVFYFAVELSPTKPYPDFMRYVIPIVPVVAYFAVKGIKIMVGMFPIYQKMVTSVAVIVFLLIPIYVSGRLIDQLKTENDPRYMVQEWLKERDAKALFGYYASLTGDVTDVANPALIEGYRKEGVTHLVYCSFTYQRYVEGLKLKNQSEMAYTKGRFYQEIFDTYPYIDIEPPYKWFAFSGPTIRVVDITDTTKD